VLFPANPYHLGLLLAGGCATTNVAMDVLQKRALVGRPLYPTILSARLVVFLLLTALALVRSMQGQDLPWSSTALRQILHTPHFIPMLLLNGLLLAASTVCYNRALQKAPLSLTVPFLTFTPAFLLLTSHLVLQERLSFPQVEAVGMIVFGSLLMYRAQFAVNLWEPLRALAHEPGSRYMLMAAIIMALTNSLEKWLVVRSSVSTFAWFHALVLGTLMSIVTMIHLSRNRESFRDVAWGPVCGASLAETVTLALQFAAMTYLPAVVTIGVKRSGILLAVLSGWFFFHERQIATRLSAATVMVCGAMMLSFPFTQRQRVGLVLAMVLLGLLGPRLLKRERVLRSA